MLAALALALLLAQPDSQARREPPPLPPHITIQRPPVPILGPGPKPAPAPEADEDWSDRPTLRLLMPSQRRAVQEEARHYRRFPDGSLWTSRPYAARLELLSKPGPWGEGAKLAGWYCPATGKSAEDADQIYDAIDAEKNRAALAASGVKFYDGRVAMVLPDGLLVHVEGDVLPRLGLVFVAGFPRQDKVTDLDAIGLMVREKGRYQYRGLTMPKLEWTAVSDSKGPRTNEPVSAEELALACYNGEIPKELPRWRVMPCVLRDASSSPANFVDIGRYGYTSPEQYHNKLYGWKIEMTPLLLDFDARTKRG